MEILMLGHSASGKTSFMAALYYRMLSGVNDYTMKYDYWENYYYKHYICSNYNYSIEDAISEEDALNIVCNNIVKGIYPPSTAIKQEYLFKMKYKDFKEISFNWFDYRGGALMEKSNGSNDISELMKKVKQCDALIVFLDGPSLEEGIEKHGREFRRLVYLVRSAISNVKTSEGAYFPISFVITKEDLCDNIFDSNGLEYFTKELFSSIRDSKNIAGMLTCTTINRESIFNVHFPLLFSILHCMHKYIQETCDAYKRRERERGIFASIREYFTEEDYNTTNEILNQLNLSRDSLQKLINEQHNNSLFLF